MGDIVTWLTCLASVGATFAGGFLCVYWADRKARRLRDEELVERREELVERREVLLRAARREMECSRTDWEEFDEYTVHYSTPISLRATSQLLDGQVLNYREHRQLLAALWDLDIALTGYNGVLSVANPLDYSVPRGDPKRRAFHALVIDRYKEILAARERVLSYLPPLDPGDPPIRLKTVEQMTVPSGPLVAHPPSRTMQRLVESFGRPQGLPSDVRAAEEATSPEEK